MITVQLICELESMCVAVPHRETLAPAVGSANCNFFSQMELAEEYSVILLGRIPECRNSFLFL